jgi:hypothetical protein
VHTLERRFWGVVVGVNLPYSAFYCVYLLFQRRIDYKQHTLRNNMEKKRIDNGLHGIIALVKCYGEEMELTKDELADIWYCIGAVGCFGVNNGK